MFLPAAYFRTAVFVFCLLLISAEDCLYRRIQNRLILGLLFGWLLSAGPDLNFLIRRVISAFLVALFAFLVSFLFRAFTGKRGLGGGDSKLFFAAALYLGGEKGLYLLFGSCLFALVFLLFRKPERGGAFPFGPFISLAALLLLFF